MSGIQRHFVKLKGDPVHLQCDSHCEVEGSVRWTFQSEVVAVDKTKYFLTQENGLLLLNSTTADKGQYRCEGETVQGSYVTLSQHAVNVTGKIYIA